MKHKRYYSIAILAAMSAMLWSCGDSEKKLPVDPPPGPIDENKYAVPVKNANFEDGLEGWTRVNFHNGDRVTVEVVEGQGVNDTKCLKIQQFPESGKCGVGIKQKLTGLEPEKMYRMTAQLKYSDIPNNEGRGALIFDLSSNQYWNSSKFTYGASLKHWSTVSVDFLAQPDGTAEIVCSLGFRLGGSSSGGYSTGTAYFDNVKVVKVSDELYVQEGEYVRFYIEPSHVTASPLKVKEWINNLDKMYLSYKELVGGVPIDGRKLTVLTTKGIEGGYWALAGYPILWSSNYSAVTSTLNELNEHGTWSFGIMHEMGHTFNIGSTNWNWDDELFANFRMHYGLEQNSGSVWMNNQVYTGSDILNLYKKSYEESISTTVKGDAIHYMLGRLTDPNVLGWEPFKMTFRELNSGTSVSGNRYAKFENFLNVLSKHASDYLGRAVDVKADYFSEAEINTIKKSLQ